MNQIERANVTNSSPIYKQGWANNFFFFVTQLS